MENEIQIFRSNNVTLTAGSKAIIKVDAGIYDLDFSGVQLDFVFAQAAAHFNVLARIDIPQGFGEILMYIDKKQRFIAQNGTSLAQLAFINGPEYQTIFPVLQLLTNAGAVTALQNQIQHENIQLRTIAQQAGNTSGSVFYHFRKFFPGIQEKYLVINDSMYISLTLNTVTGILVQCNSTTLANPAVTTSCQYLASNAVSISPFLIMKQVHGLIPSQIPQQPECYVDSITISAKTVDEQTFKCGEDEISYYSGLIIQDAKNGTGVIGTNNAVFLSNETKTNLTGLQITKNDFDIIVASDYGSALCQCRALKQYQKDQDSFSFLLHNLVQNSSIKYYVNIQGAANSEITFMFQRVKQPIQQMKKQQQQN